MTNLTQTTSITQWGVQHLNGQIEEISEAAANEGYMTAQEYATRRAEAVNGKVIKRTRKVTVSK